MTEDSNIEIIATVSKCIPEIIQTETAILVKGDGFLHIHGTETLKLAEVDQLIKKYYQS